jgi:hypothetical protein
MNDEKDKLVVSKSKRRYRCLLCGINTNMWVVEKTSVRTPICLDCAEKPGSAQELAEVRKMQDAMAKKIIDEILAERNAT